jgi:multicomponent Na+:H+ antiporter subunit D
MNNLVAWPVFIPILAAGILIAIPNARLQRILNLLACAAHLFVGVWLLQMVMRDGIQVVHFGNWPAPFGICFVADALSATMIVATGLTGLLVAVYALADIEGEYEKFGFYPLYQILIMGVSGAFLTGDLFNLFVWFEVMLMASFVLLALGSRKAQLRGGIKYLVLNFLSSGIFLTGLGILYAETGTLNMADMAVILREGDLSYTVMTSAMLLLVAFGIKAAVFPVFSWLPASYHTPKVTVTAIFGGLLSKVGVYSLMRAFTLIFVGDAVATHEFIIVISVLTMITGVLGAAAQFEMKRLLAFHIVSQIGYMTLGLGLFTAGALAAGIYYILHNILAKTNLFLVAGAIAHVKGSTQLKEIGGLYKSHPWLAVVFLISAMALAGMPPLSGFLGKFFLVKEAVPTGHWFAIAAALGVGLLTLYSMVKIWAEAFWKTDPREESGGRVDGRNRAIPVPMWVAMVLMAMATLAISLSPEWIFAIVNRAGEELMDPSRYINAVLEARGL